VTQEKLVLNVLTLPGTMETTQISGTLPSKDCASSFVKRRISSVEEE
jgi:hypothetical protein